MLRAREGGLNCVGEQGGEVREDEIWFVVECAVEGREAEALVLQVVVSEYGL